MFARKLAAALLLVVSSVASAAWPERPVRIIIPWPPGGSTDIVGRILAADLTNRLKQQLMVAEQNKWLDVIKRAGIKGE